ncbi:MAG: methyl-accepting chemotaxis protein [Symploca sp. SIO2B6]|nr:methyl-accepting chemotaxis protein [Symploca sp. SIO2B6]
MTQTPPQNSAQKNDNDRSWSSNGFPVGGQTNATDDSSYASELFPSATGSPLEQQQAPWWHFPSMRLSSLRTKATLLAVAIGTIPVVLVGSTAYFAASQGIRQQIIQNEKTNAEDLADKLNIFIEQRYKDTVALSQFDILINPNVRQVVTTEEKNQILNANMESSKIYNSIAAFDPKTAEVIAFAGSNFNPEKIISRDYSLKVQETNNPVIVDPRVAGGTGEFSLFVAAPIKDQFTNKTIGIIRTRTSMTLLNQAFGVDPSRGQQFYLTDSTGQITASSDSEALQKKIEELFPKVNTKIQQGDQQALTMIASENRKEQIFTYLPDSELKAAYGLNWGLLVTRPTEVAFAPQKQLLWTLLIGTIIVTSIVAAIAVVIVNRATIPIIAATNAVARIGQGDLETRMEVKGEDELAQLGANINDMAGQIKTLLEEQVLVAEEKQRFQEEQRYAEALQNRILELLEEVEPVSRGDLTIKARVTADDVGTVADSYNFMISNLRQIVSKVQAAASNVAETTKNNEFSVQSLSVEASRQAEEIAQILKQAQEMTESVRLVAFNAQKAATVVQQAAQTVEEGDSAMNRTVDGIVAIRETVAQTRQKVKYLGESSQKISTVVNLISSFAAQTKLLAFNASIEAARAGEEGRGFAVVADEVRTLAQQSAEASTEIEKLVAAIQGETNEVIAAMEAGTEQVVTGTRLVEETRESLNKITTASTEINQLVEAITKATISQSTVSETVTQTMTNIAETSKQTSKEAILVSSSFEQLRVVAQELQEDVSQFKIS